MSASYTTKDGRHCGPQALGARQMRTLRHMALQPVPVVMAPQQIERLRIGGYCKVEHGMATITEAGRAAAERGSA